MNLSVYVLTRGRLHKQRTMQSFQLEAVASLCDDMQVTFVVPDCEYKAFKKLYPRVRVKPVSDRLKTGSINQYIADQKGSRWRVWMDDDFTLLRRRDPESTSQKGATVKCLEDAIDFFDRIRDWFSKGYRHGAISMANANHYSENLFQENGRACGLVFFDAVTLRKEGIRFDAVQEHQAFHVALSLLELGYMNVIDFEFMFSHHGTNADGGCSRYRSVDYLEKQNRKLVSLHPKGVKLFYRKLKGDAAKSIATDEGIPAVRVQWAKSLGILASQRKATNLEGVKLCIG